MTRLAGVVPTMTTHLVPTGTVNLKTALENAGLGFTVEKAPLFRKDAEGNLIETKSCATVRMDTGEQLGTVGKGYHVLQNAEAMAFFQDWLEGGHAKLETLGSLRSGKRVWIQARLNESDPIEVVPGDAVNLFVLLANSHDGSMAVSTGFVGNRVVCENTLMMAIQTGKLLKVRHTVNAVQALDKIKDVINLANREFVATAEQWKELSRRGVTESSLRRYVRRVFNPIVVDGEEKDSEKGGERVADNVIKLYEENKYGTKLGGANGTAWGAYNAVNSYLNHERGRSNDTRQESLWFGQGAKLDRRALKVAQQMFG